MRALRGRIERDGTRACCPLLLTWTLLTMAAPPLAAQETPRAAADPDDQITRGVVLNPDGQPAANVEVWLTRTASWIESVDLLGHTRTDGTGRFQVTVPGRWFQSQVGARQELAFIARSEKCGLAAFAFHQYSPVPIEGIQLNLPSSSQTAIKVMSPDKKPVAGARLTIQYAGGPKVVANVPDDPEEVAKYESSDEKAVRTPNGLFTQHASIALPAELRKIFAGTTAEDGSVVIKGIAPEQVRSVEIATEQFGVQVITYVRDQPPGPKASWPAEIVLSATGNLRGKLTAKNPDWIKGRHLVISAFDYNTKPEDVTRTSGMAEVTTDEAGRFEVAALSTGDLRFPSPVDPKSRSCISPPRGLKIAAGKLCEIELPIVPVMRVRGLVQEVEGGKPIANLGLTVGRLGDETVVRTDREGNYEVDLPAGEVMVSPLLPASLLPARDKQPMGGGLYFVVLPEGTKEGKTFQPNLDTSNPNLESGKHFPDAPPLKLRRATMIRGVVVDDAGQPVAGATVDGSWYGYSRRDSRPASQDVTVVTNDRGEFVLAGVDLRSELLLRAHTASQCTAKATTLRTAPSEPVSLQISTSNMARLKGRIVDSAGKPVANLPLALSIRGRLAVPSGQRAVEQPGTARRVAFSDGQALRTDAQGEFVSPLLEADQQYRFELRSRGFRDATGDWVALAAGKTLEIAELAVRRITEDRGLVRDAQGKPVAKAAVTFAEPTRRFDTVTDEKGEFRLGDIADGDAFLFVRKAGRRFYGERYAARGTGPLEIRLEAPDEAHAAAFKIVPAEFPLADRRARAVKLLEQTLDAKNDDDERREQQRMRTLEAWARVDPAAALARLEKQRFKEELFGEIIRNAAMKALAVRDVDAALEIVETMSPGYGRAQSLVELCDFLPEGERQRKLDLLADALVTVRGIKEPEMRLGGIVLITQRLTALGEQQRAEKLFRDELDTARQLGTAAFAGYARGAYAEKFGVFDLPAALELIRDLKDSFEFNRHHGNLAHELAGKSPADAEKVLNLLKTPKELHFSDHDSYSVRVCYRMASIDLPRAERIAASIVDMSQRGYALGVMADSLAAKDAKQGRELLRRAYDVLDEGARDWKSGIGPNHPAVIAGALLPTARKLDTDAERLPLLRECLWRTVAIVPPATSDPTTSWYAVETGASVALWLAEFDAPLARDVLMRVDASQAASSRTYAPALALVAPDRLDAFIDAAPEGTRNTIRLSAAVILPLEGLELRRKIHHHTGIWPIDVDDLVW